ncbi:MAG: hypothetical protein IPO85_20060 [Saprospiraceae bacterium]|uniref:Uncharacterized protein n=1 Tax=Candidatus Defluviibacterium haderslevense TaxID=2981993 RepID=A0A9D7SDS3_9BACT|nr:hypothetical protein [Candidatus Defluviibacterium haderslevense]
MPINIYNQTNNEKLDWLCDDVWDLPNQIHTLEKWLRTKGISLPKSSYVADIGFAIRKDATGGGAVLNSETMKIMSDIGMDIFLSEYPNTLPE